MTTGRASSARTGRPAIEKVDGSEPGRWKSPRSTTPMSPTCSTSGSGWRSPGPGSAWATTGRSAVDYSVVSRLGLPVAPDLATSWNEAWQGQVRLGLAWHGRGRSAGETWNGPTPRPAGRAPQLRQPYIGSSLAARLRVAARGTDTPAMRLRTASRLMLSRRAMSWSDSPESHAADMRASCRSR